MTDTLLLEGVCARTHDVYASAHHASTIMLPPPRDGPHYYGNKSLSECCIVAGNCADIVVDHCLCGGDGRSASSGVLLLLHALVSCRAARRAAASSHSALSSPAHLPPSPPKRAFAPLEAACGGFSLREH